MSGRLTTNETSALSLLNALAPFSRIAITGHVSPDGDAIGSCVAMARILTQLGHTATIAIDPETVGPPRFLLNYAPINVPESSLKSEDFDALLMLDCANPSRMPEAFQALAKSLPLFIIDHHCYGQAPSEPHFIDSQASSTGELIYTYAQVAQVDLDRESAESLWVALITDTGRFAYSCTHPSTLRMAASLLDKGIDTATINDIIYLYASQESITLKRRAYDSLRTACNGLVAVVTLNHADFCETGLKKTDVEDIIDIPRSILSAGVAIFVYEPAESPGQSRASIRTRPPYDATLIAKPFGGGGHIRAAGCSISGSAAEATAKIIQSLEVAIPSQT